MGDKPSSDGGTNQTHDNKPSATPLVHIASALFQRTEQFIYIALGTVLSLTALLVLAGAGKLLFDGIIDWTSTIAPFGIIDRLLLVLMLIEILYTIRASTQSGVLSSEPFLIVGLIACIRRILVISLETSNVTQPSKWSSESAEVFRASMIELGVLGWLVIVMVGAICFIRKYRIG